jgi:recombination DNA repair RAD52 pathway protein
MFRGRCIVQIATETSGWNGGNMLIIAMDISYLKEVHVIHGCTKLPEGLEIKVRINTHCHCG